MNFFKCENGKFINADLVACFWREVVENKHFVVYMYASGIRTESVFDSAYFADAEMGKFKQHVEWN